MLGEHAELMDEISGTVNQPNSLQTLKKFAESLFLSLIGLIPEVGPFISAVANGIGSAVAVSFSFKIYLFGRSLELFVD